MSTIPLTQESFETTIDQGGIVLVDWWASWCGPCRRFAPIYEKVAAKHEDITFGKVDTEAEPALAAAFEIRAIPTLMIFRDGVPVFAQAGMVAEAGLEDLVRQVRALDMNEVRERIAKSA